MSLWNRPRLAMVELTNHCNLRCVMCGIWEEMPKHVFDLTLYEDVLSQKAIRNIPVLALTGGEPFLIKNFGDYYALARERSPRSHINISTNGYYTDRTLAFLEEADRRRTSVTISYDGIRSHDRVRRFEGSQEKLLETATRIRRAFPELRVSLKLTVTNDNYGEILDTARQCQELDVPFRFKTLEKLVCHQGRFPSEVKGPEYAPEVVASISDQARAVLDLPIETNRRYIESLTRKNAGADEPCSCSPKTLFLGIDGNVFLCRKTDPIGNLHDARLDDIWESARKKQAVRAMALCQGAPQSLGFRHD